MIEIALCDLVIAERFNFSSMLHTKDIAGYQTFLRFRFLLYGHEISELC